MATSDPGSARFKLNRHDLWKLAKSLGLTVVAFTVILLTEVQGVIDWSSHPWGPSLAVLLPFGLNIARRILGDTRTPWQKADDFRTRARAVESPGDTRTKI